MPVCPVQILEIPVDGICHGGSQILILLPAFKGICGAVPAGISIARLDHIRVQGEQGAADFKGRSGGNPLTALFFVVYAVGVPVPVIQDKRTFVSFKICVQIQIPDLLISRFGGRGSLCMHAQEWTGYGQQAADQKKYRNGPALSGVPAEAVSVIRRIRCLI